MYFIRSVSKEEAVEFWTSQLARVREIVKMAELTQAQWEELIPGGPDKYIPSLRTVALLHLMRNFDLGGDHWVRQFVFGFPIVGEVEQTGVFPRDTKLTPPPVLTNIWTGNSARFQTRARASGHLRAQFLWDEAIDQVSKGWLSKPVPIDPFGNVMTQPTGASVIAFRFGVEQAIKYAPAMT